MRNEYSAHVKLPRLPVHVKLPRLSRWQSIRLLYIIVVVSAVVAMSIMPPGHNLTVCIKIIIVNTKFITVNAKSIVLIQISSILMQIATIGLPSSSSFIGLFRWK